METRTSGKLTSPNITLVLRIPFPFGPVSWVRIRATRGMRGVLALGGHRLVLRGMILAIRMEGRFGA